jgi:hypothetical protein
MNLAAQPEIEAGRTFRTEDLRRWSANPARLAKRLVRQGRLRQAARGLFYASVQGRFGQAPAAEDEVLRAFLRDDAFVITGPPKWNALGLGSTAMFAATLVYNRKRTGEFTFDGRRFLLRRVLFPSEPPPEWFVVDLLQHHDTAGVTLAELAARLVARIADGCWNPDRLRELARRYGTKATAALIERCIEEAGARP